MKHIYEHDAKRQGHYWSFHRDSGQWLIYTPDGGLLAAVADDEVARRTVAKLDLGTPDLDTLGRYLHERNEAQTQAEQHLRERECMRELRDELSHERVELMNQIQELSESLQMKDRQLAAVRSEANVFRNQRDYNAKEIQKQVDVCKLKQAAIDSLNVQLGHTRKLYGDEMNRTAELRKSVEMHITEFAPLHSKNQELPERKCQDQVAKDIAKLCEDLRIARIEAQQMREAYENLRTQRDAEVTGVEGDRLRRDLGMAQAVNGKLTSDLAHRDAVLGQIRNLLEEDDE